MDQEVHILLVIAVKKSQWGGGGKHIKTEVSMSNNGVWGQCSIQLDSLQTKHQYLPLGWQPSHFTWQPKHIIHKVPCTLAALGFSSCTSPREHFRKSTVWRAQRQNEGIAWKQLWKPTGLTWDLAPPGLTFQALPLPHHHSVNPGEDPSAKSQDDSQG